MSAQLALPGQPPSPNAALSQFDTPRELALHVATWARIEPGSDVLEPSAGLGNLASAAWRAGGHVRCYEIDTARVEHLNRLGLRAVYADFLGVPVGRVDLIVANPPYEDGQDLEHVLRMLEWAPRVVAILPLGMLDGVERQRRLWRQHTLSRLLVLVRRFKAAGSEMSGQRPFGVFEIMRGKVEVRQSIEWW